MGVLEAIKTAAEIAQKAGNMTLYSQILEAQGEALDLQEENGTLRRRIQELEDEIAARKRLTYQKGGKYFYLHEDGTEEGPICPLCWKEKRIIQTLTEQFRGGPWFCQHCDESYSIPLANR